MTDQTRTPSEQGTYGDMPCGACGHLSSHHACDHDLGDASCVDCPCEAYATPKPTAKRTPSEPLARYGWGQETPDLPTPPTDRLTADEALGEETRRLSFAAYRIVRDRVVKVLAAARAEGEHKYLDQLSDLRARLWDALRPNLEPDGIGSDDALVDKATRLWCHHAEAQGHEEQARRDGVAQGQQEERELSRAILGSIKRLCNSAKTPLDACFAVHNATVNALEDMLEREARGGEGRKESR